MAYLCGTTNSICISTYDGDRWSPPQTLIYTSSTPPALAHDPTLGGLVLVFGAAAGGGTLLYSAYDGNWHNAFTMTENSHNVVATKTPALAIHDGRIHMVFEGTDRLLHHTSYNRLLWDDTTVVYPKTEQSSPALASYAGLLHLFHRGASDNKIYWSSSPDGSTTSWTSDLSFPSTVSQDSPAVASTGLLLVMAHMGNGNSNLFYTSFQP